MSGRISMHKKDYEFIALCINSIPGEASLTKSDIARHFGTMLYITNPQFNKEKFIEACISGKHIRKSIKFS